MRDRSLLLALAAVAVVPSFLAAAQSTFSNSKIAAPLELQGGSARSAVLGAGFSAMADDAAATFWNPAGLGRLQHGEVSLHQNFGILDVGQDGLLLAAPAASLGGVGLGISRINFGDFDRRNEAGDSIGSYTAERMGGQLAWGRSWGDHFSFGLGARMTTQSIDGISSFAASGDAGLLFVPWKKLTLGLAYSNLGSPLEGGTLASAGKAAVAVRALESKQGGLTLAVGGSLEPDSISRVQFGAEGEIMKILFPRLGYRLDLASETAGALAGLSVGIGFKVAKVAVDYGFFDKGLLGSSHRVSVAYQFEMPKDGSSSGSGSTQAEEVAPQPPLSPVLPQAVAEEEKSKDGLVLQFGEPQDWYLEGKRFQSQGNKKQAFDAFFQAVKKNPQDARAWEALGRIYYESGQKAYAIQAYERHLTLSPNAQLKEWLEKYKATP